MKRVLAISVLGVTMLIVFALSASAFFSFGYTHGIPDNDGKLFAGFAFGPESAEYNVGFYLTDMWDVKPNNPNKGSTLMCLGVEGFYLAKTDMVDVKVGTYCESIPLFQYPTVGVAEVGFYGDLTVHVLGAQTVSNVVWDIFGSLDVGIDIATGNLILDAEVGFLVEL